MRLLMGRTLALFLIFTSPILAQRQGQQIGLSPELTQNLANMLERDPKSNDDWAKMASQILGGRNTMGIGNGWYQAAAATHDWKWLRENFDKSPRNNKVTRRELPDFVTDTHFNVLDRDGNGSITSADLRWKKNHIMEPETPDNNIFNRFDTDSNGRVTRAEFEKFFDKHADGFEFLTPDDLKKGLQLRPMVPSSMQQTNRNFQMPLPRRWQMFDMFLRGDLGNLEPGPAVGEDAPDFNLPLMVRNEAEHKLELSNERIKLSDAKGKRPVVLIFGSFT